MEVHNAGGALRVLVTKNLPGDRWLKVLTAAGCRVEVCSDPDTILSNEKIKKLIGDKCDGVIGQLTEVRPPPAAAACAAASLLCQGLAASMPCGLPCHCMYEACALGQFRKAGLEFDCYPRPSS